MYQTKNKFVSVLTGLMTLCFIQSASADLSTAVKVQESLVIQSKIGTDSAGSYAHGEKKSEGRKSKAYSKKGYSHSKKSEGSKNKAYSKKGSGHHKSKSGHGKHGGYNKHSGHKKSHYAKSSHKKHGSHSSKCFFSHLLSFKHKLQLTDAQVEGIQKMRFDYRKTSVMLKAEKEVAKMDFDRLVHGKTVDAPAIRAAGEKIVAAKTKKIRAKVEAKIAVMKLLTDAQRNKVHKMHSSH